MNASELRFWLDKIGSLPTDFEEAQTSIQSLEVTLVAVVQHLSSSGPAELGDLVVGQMCQKLLDTVRHLVPNCGFYWPFRRGRLEQQLHAVRACIDSRLSWGSQAPPPDTSRLELHHALDLFRNEFAPAAVVQDAANKLGLLQQEMQTLRSEFASAAVVQDAANKWGLLQQEMQTLRSEFASAAVVQDAANKLGLLQQEMQTLRSEFAPAAVVQDAANKWGLLQQEMQTLRSEFASAAVVQDAANKWGLLQQEMQTLWSEFAPAAVVQDAANKLGLLQQQMQTLRSEFAPASVVQEAADKLGLLQQQMQTLRSEFASAAVVQDAANKWGLLQQEMQTLRSEFAPAAVVQDAANKLGLMEAQQQNMLDSLRRERSGLIQQLSGLAAAARSSDSASEASWVCPSCGGSDTQGSSVTSGISVETSGGNCFMRDAAFKSETGSVPRERSGLIQQLSGLAAAARSSDSASEASWVRPSCGGSDTQGSSVTSGISVETSGGNCFMRDAAFKSETGALVPGSALHKGQQVLAANGSVLEVANEPEDHEARATVLLKAGAAELEVTPDHRVLLSDNRMAP